jgi:asparagine synthase (glutamine-hydrolysing)
MSGIAGIIRLDANTATGLPAMLHAMARRGPDRQAQWCEGNAGFGQALLATTREALAERQPWAHPDSGCVVVSDSRLDNRPQLLRELGIGRPADEVGDGELLHAAWQRWGEGCAERLRGDFAFAIWKPAAQELFLARDPMGVRPLAFHFEPGRRFVFASTADAVIAQGEVPTELDEGRIADALIMVTEGIDQTSTFYTAVQRLPPAHWLRLCNGALARQCYWRPITDRPNGLPRSTEEWIEAQREQLDRAVRLRLRSHRPVGSMLSGGLDSSSVVALAAAACTQSGHSPLPVFSATNSADPDCSETRHIHAVIDHVRCAPTCVDLPDFERDTAPAKAWWHKAGEPFDGSMSLVGALYQAAAAQGVTSMMDGVPADNLFVIGQYARRLFAQGRWREAWQAAVTQWQVPGALRPRANAIRVMAGCLVPEAGHALRQYAADARHYRALLASSLIDPAFAGRIKLWRRYRRYRRSISDAHQWHDTDEALSSMTAFYITAGLERYNRVASLFGVEPRPPFVDRDLIEFQAWVPIALRTRHGDRKWILRQAMSSGLLPPSVAWRKDKGHVGWRFSRAEFGQLRVTGLLQAEAPDADWFDTRRVATAWRQPAGMATEGLLAVARMSLWRDRLNREKFQQDFD